MTNRSPQCVRPQLFAHRGAMAERPENTQIAFDTALQHSIDGIEFDVQLSEDGVPVIFHDDTLDRIAGQGGRVSDFTYETLSRFDYGRWFSGQFAGTPIMSLEYALRRYAGKTDLMIELKTGATPDARKRRALVERVLQVIDETVSHRHRPGIFILSFDAEVLTAAHKITKDLKCIRNLKRPVGNSSDADPSFEVCCGFGLPLRRLTREFVAETHRAGKQVMTYSCDTPAQVDKAVNAGVDFVLTDDPAGVAAYFDQTVRMKHPNK